MKTLAQYLAEYLNREHESDKGLNFIDSYPDGSVYLDVDCLKQMLRQGIDAYESTENCTITMAVKADDNKPKQWQRIKGKPESEIAVVVAEIETMKERLLSFIKPKNNRPDNSCFIVNSAMDGIRKTIEDKLRLCGKE